MMENSLANTSDMSTMSMYFDAESTMSSVAFKTLDTSELSFIDDAPVASQNSTSNENDENAYSSKQLKNVMKSNVNASPLRPHNRINFQGFNGLSSTPGKAQIVKRRSEVGPAIDFARMEINDAAIVVAEENKESIMNSESEASTLSASSSVELMNTTIENKTPNMTINNNDVGEHLTDEASTPRIDDLIKNGQNDSTNTSRTSVGSLMKEISKEVNEIKLLVNGTHVKLNEEDVMPKIVEISDDETDETAERMDILKPIEKDLHLKYSAKKNLPKPSKLAVPRRSLITPQTNRNIRKSICEPNLKTNRPSRIATSVNATANKRMSLIPKGSALDIQEDSNSASELPELLEKMMKLANKDGHDGIKSKYPSRSKTKASGSSDGGQKGRFTMAPTLSTHTEKRLFNKRLSTAAKTTQNSPARRVQRKSGAINIGQSRKSFAVQQGAGGDNTDFKAIAATLLQNSLAGGRKASKPRQSVAKNSFARDPLKSTYARDAVKTMEAKLAAAVAPTKPKPIVLSTKPDLAFACSICGNKYRIKSLLDAHKHIHENESAPPNGKKLSPATSVSHLNNQCKYCDKKFALVRALHIHLMQNCPKIPPSDKRKLRFTEMDHVEKAKIPVFNNSTNSTSANNSANNATIVNLKAMQGKPFKAYNTAAISSDESFTDRKDYPPYENKRMAPPPPKSTKSKKKNAHSGVRRTPNKSLACHLYGDEDSATSDNL